MIKKAFKEQFHGIKVDGKIVNAVRFAADKAILVSSEEDVQELITNLSDITEKYEMIIQVKKTKLMMIKYKQQRKTKETQIKLN